MADSTSHLSAHQNGASGLGAYFKTKRIEQGLSLAAVSDYLEKVSIETLESYERGLAAMPVWVIYGLANLLNISPLEILLKMQASRPDEDIRL